MNMIEQQICDAIELIVDRAIDQANYDKTIQATVVSCIDATIGKYKVRYQDSTFYAYSGSSDVTYTNGSTVYILIPGNDTEADKTILGTTKKLGINYVATIEDDEAYQIIGNNCILFSSEIFKLQSYKKSEDNQVKVLYSKDYSVNQNLINLNITAINEYIKNQGTIICGAVVRTALPAEQQFRGNYGIVFALNFLDNATESIVTRYYVIDVDKMRGNPYKILYDTRQYGVFDIDGKNFIEVDSISIFCYDFPNSKPDKDCIDDIFIQKIELQGAERLNSDDISNYSLTFYTPQGIYFDSTSLMTDTRAIDAQVRVKGKVIDNNSQKLPFYWFIEHAGINSESTYYNKFGGQGWKCLNNYTVIKKATETDPEVVEWIPSSYRWIVSKKDIAAKEVKYKCAVVYEGTVISKTIVIKNLNSNYDITIESDQGTKFYFDNGFPTLKCLVNGKENNDLTYSWAVINNVGTFENMPETPVANQDYLKAFHDYYVLLNNIQAELLPLEPNRRNLEIRKQELDKYDKITRVEGNRVYHINVNAITNFSTYQCTVYQGNLYLGTSSIALTNSLTAEGEYNLIIHDGSCVYKYNESGISPASKALDSPINIKALTFSVYDNLGNRIDDEVVRHSNIQWIVPINNTMIKIPSSYDKYEEDLDRGVRIYKDFMSFAYEIQDRYDITKVNNDIQVMVNFKGMMLSSKTDLVFAKEGDAGTNGTEFFCRIVPNVIDGKDAPLYPIITEASNYSWSINYSLKSGGDTSIERDLFRVQLWHNELKILDSIRTAYSNEGKQATIKWSVLKNQYNVNTSDSSSLTVKEDTGKFTYDGYKSNSPANIVKVELTYDGVVYYATIPVITVKINNDNYKIRLKEGTGFTTVIYSSDGKKPRYDNINPFELIVTQKISGYDEDISTKKSDEYRLTYQWSFLGRTFENNLWSNNINLTDRLILGSEEVEDNQLWAKPLDDYDGWCVSNAIECIILQKNLAIGKIHIPIHLMLNRYGNSAINGWDGNSVNIDSEGGFILAPQVGAGIKEKDNSFTGVVIGKVKETNQLGDDIGLIGYAQGRRSIFLDANSGKAVFGATGKGQITIDPGDPGGPGTARLYSGNFNYRPDGTGTGMEIDLTTPQIRFGSGNFEVNSDGKITAKGGGSIAGWNITDTELYSTGDPNDTSYSRRKITLDSENVRIYSGTKNTFDSKTQGFYLDPDNLKLGNGFSVNSNGIVKVGNLSSHYWTISGRMKSSDAPAFISYGRDVNVGSDLNSETAPSISSTPKSSTAYIGTDGILIGTGFRAYANGAVNVGRLTSERYWTIDGGGTNSYIAYGGTTWHNAAGDESSDSSAKVYLGTDGISLGNRFSVSRSGELVSYSGSIGGWTITRNSLEADSGNIKISSLGSITGGRDGGKNWAIRSDGTATFENVTITGGTISIGGSGSGAPAYIASDGSATFSNIGVTGGSIALGGTTLRSTKDGTISTTLTAGSTNVGDKSLNTYVKDLVVDNLSIKGKFLFKNDNIDWRVALTAIDALEIIKNSSGDIDHITIKYRSRRFLSDDTAEDGDRYVTGYPRTT